MATWKKTHPDLTETGDIKWQAYRYTDPQERRFMEMWSDPARRERFMAEVEARQAEEDDTVQKLIQSRTYLPDGTAYAGFREYEAARQWARDQAASFQGGRTIIHGDDVAKMSLDEYDRYFDERGRPREGVVYRGTSRDVSYDDSSDRTTQRELRYRRGSA